MIRAEFFRFSKFRVTAAYCAKVLFFCVLTLLLPFSVFSLTIDNPKIDIQLDKGKAYSGAITVDNNSDKDVRIKVYAEDFIYVEPFDGSKEFLASGTSSFSLSSWLTVSETEFALKPYEHRIVNFVLQPQENIERVHCGVIFFETAIGRTLNDKGEGIDILGRVGSIIFIEPQNLQKKGEFNEITTDLKSFRGIFVNKGNTFLHVQGTYYIINSNEMVEDRGQINELYLLPQDKTKVIIKAPEKISEGKYTMVITFDLEGGEAAVKEIDFSVSPTGELSILAVRD